MNTPTNDMSLFGYRELEMARDLLDAYINNNNTEYLNDGVQIMFNQNSGNVFFSDEDYNVAMVTYDSAGKGSLEDWFYTPYEGHEGFMDDLLLEYDNMHKEDQEYINSIRNS